MRRLIILIAVLLATTVGADQFSLYLENDVCFSTDHDYTHGTRLQYTFDIAPPMYVAGLALGQNIYTPEDKSATRLIADDRPYAGYLYGSVFEVVDIPDFGLYTVEAQLGVTGPYSYAEQTQTWIHEHIHSEIPRGWDNQVHNHLAAAVLGTYTYPVYASDYLAVDPYATVGVGNITDTLGGGLNVYAGYNLPGRRVQHVIPYKLAVTKCRPYVYVYAGVEPRWVAYSMILEDPRFTIHVNPFVYDQSLGAVVGCRYCEVEFTVCCRSREFEEQPVPERFGSVKLTRSF